MTLPRAPRQQGSQPILDCFRGQSFLFCGDSQWDFPLRFEKRESENGSGAGPNL